MRRWGEWFVHERAEHVCKEAEDAGLKHFTCFVKGRLINQVLETRFPGGHITWKKRQITPNQM